MSLDEMLKHGKLQTIAMQYDICLHCRIVDTSMSRMLVGTPCPTCRRASEGGMMFFDSTPLTIIDLLQEAYCAIPVKADASQLFSSPPELAHTAAVVIFFCILRETLLERFLSSVMRALDLPEAIQDRLSADNHQHMQRLQKLFPALVGINWDEAIDQVQADTSESLTKLDTFLKRVSNVRNTFVHKGFDFRMEQSLAKECLENVSPMLLFFTLLHNRFVHPRYFQKISL